MGARAEPAVRAPATAEVSPDLAYVTESDFTAFYRREHRAVVGLAYVLCGSQSVAEDLAQDAFVAAFRGWSRIARYDDPGAWVRRVVANRSVSRFRRLASEAKALMHLGRDDRSEEPISADTLALWAEVRRLPARQAQALALRYVDGRSLKEVARILECSENTVKTHVLRAKQTLAIRLKEAPQ